MQIRIELLAPWSVAVYLDGEIQDCFDCADEAVAFIRTLRVGFANVTVTEGEGYAQACAKAERRGFVNKPYNQSDQRSPIEEQDNEH
jgi:hypothetical protein